MRIDPPADDLGWMQRALSLAERGRGFVEPNPLVGAVVVQGGQAVGEGFHQKFGEAHAEIHALNQAGEQARGATLYVTLEPCCHFGKTPPCTDAILKAGIARVVAALEDPFPKVAGQGAETLRQAGVTVEFGTGNRLARLQNAPYLKLLAARMPYVHAKWAMTLDGKIASRTGNSQWISNASSRRKVHELRGRVDGILVGIGTVLADDPLLTARPPGPRTPTRVVLDRHGRIPPLCQLVQTARVCPTLVFVDPGAPPDQCRNLAHAGCEVVPAPLNGRNQLDLEWILQELGSRRWTNLLVEGGSQVHGSFFDADLVDEVHVFLGPRILGGRDAFSPVSGEGRETIQSALSFEEQEVAVLDGDIYWHGRRGIDYVLRTQGDGSG